MKPCHVVLTISTLLFLAACSGKIATPAGQECSETLRLAEKEYEEANTESLRGSLEMIKAANLMSQASFQKQFEKFEGCIDKARRARIYIEEAKKK
jgi:hypothetical protein